MNLLAPTLRATERERAVRRLVEEWEATFGAIADGIAVLDASRHVLRANPAFRRLLRIGEGESLAGMLFDDLFARQEGSEVRAPLAEAFALPGSPVSLKLRRRWIEVTVTTIDDPIDVGVGYVALLADVSAKRQLHQERLRLRRRTLEANALRAEAERLTALEHMKTAILNLVSHELRTPLTVLAGYVDLLAASDLGPLPENASSVLGLLNEQVARMNHLVSQMLEAARLGEGGFRLDVGRADLNELTGEAARKAADEMSWDRIELTPADGPVWVAVDVTLVRNVLVRLIDNALKFSSEKVSISVSVTGSSGNVTVVDAGSGIAPEERETVFTRFGRLVTEDNAHIPGSGLGLYIARQVARLHGGDVALDSDPQGDTRFTLSLPLSL